MTSPKTKRSAAYQKANFPEKYEEKKKKDNLRKQEAAKIRKENPTENALYNKRSASRQRNYKKKMKAENPKKYTEILKKKSLNQLKYNMKKKEKEKNANPDLLEQIKKSQSEKRKEEYMKRKELLAADPEKHAEDKKLISERGKRYQEHLKKKYISIRPLKPLFTSAKIKEIEETHFEKCLDVFPKDDEEKKVIFVALAKRFGLVVGNLSMPKSKKTLEKEKLVTDFYINDNNSQNLNEKVLKDGTPVRYLLYSLHEEYDKFNVEFPNQKICFKKFARLRPHFVKLRKQIPHRTCLCSIHENMKFALKALTSADPTFKDVAIGYDMHSNFICDGDKKVCFYNKCQLCKQSPAFFEKFEENEVNPSQSVTWEQWVTNKTAFGYIERVTKTGTVPDLLKHIKEMKANFLLHVLVKRNQAACLDSYCQQAKSEDATTAVLQVDWAKSYECKQQDEIYAAFWERDKHKVSIFTAMMWHRGEKSMAVALDSQDHTKETVIPCLHKLFSEEIPATATTVHIFSDNAPSQFKNKYTMAVLPALQKKYNKKIVWHFLAAQHGKGPADGIGGGLKTAAKNRSLAGTPITDAETFVANQCSDSKVTLKLIADDSEIKSINQEIGLDDICNNHPLQIKNIKKYYCFEVGLKGVKYKKLSSFHEHDDDDEHDDEHEHDDDDDDEHDDEHEHDDDDDDEHEHEDDDDDEHDDEISTDEDDEDQFSTDDDEDQISTDENDEGDTSMDDEEVEKNTSFNMSQIQDEMSVVEALVESQASLKRKTSSSMSTSTKLPRYNDEASGSKVLTKSEKLEKERKFLKYREEFDLSEED